MAANIVTVTTALLLMAIISSGQEQTIFNQYSNCKTSLTSQRIMELCYKEVTGQTDISPTLTAADVSDKELEDTMYCTLKKNGIIGLDGNTVNMRKANNAIDSMEATPDIKNQLKAASSDCKNKGGTGMDFTKCNLEFIRKICKN